MTASPTTSPATGKGPAQLSPVLAVPRVAPQRRWRPGLLWLGVALIAVGGLIGWRVLTSIGTTSQYLAVSQTVQIGETLTADKLTTVRITADPALKPVPAADLKSVLGQYAAVPLLPGTLLTTAQVTGERAPKPGDQLVGIGLTRDRLPAERITPGRKVLLVITAKDNASSGDKPTTSAPLTITATAVDVRPGTKDDQVLLNVAVAERDGPLVAQRAAENRIVVTLTAGD